MACACQNRRTATFLWTSDDGETQIPYPTEIQAKAKVIRNGGSYQQQ
jgi:hypothetical protein